MLKNCVFKAILYTKVKWNKRDNKLPSQTSVAEDYTSKTVRKLNERVTDHNGETKHDIFINTRKKVIIPVLYWVILRSLGAIKNLREELVSNCLLKRRDNHLTHKICQFY